MRLFTLPGPLVNKYLVCQSKISNVWLAKSNLKSILKTDKKEMIVLTSCVNIIQTQTIIYAITEPYFSYSKLESSIYANLAPLFFTNLINYIFAKQLIFRGIVLS